MAKEAAALDSLQAAPAAVVPDHQAQPSGLQIKKLAMIGIPVFIVQLAIVYFVAVKFLSPASHSPADAAAASAEAEKETQANAEPNIYLIKDLIINPAGTNGNRFLLASVGFEVSSPAALQDLQKKEIQVRDALNTILTGKTLNELVDISKREGLRAEIAKHVGGLVKNGTMKNVYFSKFIIQ